MIFICIKKFIINRCVIHKNQRVIIITNISNTNNNTINTINIDNFVTNNNVTSHTSIRINISNEDILEYFINLVEFRNNRIKRIKKIL